MKTGTRGGEPFFFYYACLLFAIVLFSFPVHAIVNTDYLPPIRPVLHFHAVTLGAWYALMVVQTRLIATGRRDFHRKLGAASLLLVLVMLPTGLFVSFENMQRTGNPDILFSNSISVAIFVLLYGAALALRNRAASHKRLMLYAGTILMPPALARVAYIFGMELLAIALIWVALGLSIIIYDLVVLRKVKLASAFGFAALLSATAIALAT